MSLCHPVLSPRAPAAPWLRRLGAAATLFGVIGLASSAALATVPSTFSYQGVLTDNSGHLVPDGPYNLTFRVYSVASGGVALWTETQNAIPVNKGGFSAVLGSVTPLSPSFDQQLYLGVAINGGAELVPRVVLTPSPQALALRLPYYGAVSSDQSLLSLINLSPGNPGLWVDPYVAIGGYQDGALAVASSALPYALATIEAFPEGGFMSCWSGTTGHIAGVMGVDVGTNAGVVTLRKGGVARVRLSGDNSGSGDPYFSMTGSSRSITLNTASSGDASVSLPTNAIAAGEILDEPGVAQGHNAGLVNISTSATVTDLVSVQITTPASGYIVVEADGMHGIGGDGANANEASFTIKDTPGGGIDFGNYYVSGFLGVAPAGLFRTSVSMRRTYSKPAGTYTFYFQASANNPAALNNYIWNPTITATFFATSYGTAPRSH